MPSRHGFQRSGIDKEGLSAAPPSRNERPVAAPRRSVPRA
ncbi:MAG: hypothetical protein AVDCRST_MAG87-2722 [uncultured Thermomicrobiales bacterium]|uniref:Uncharacterized protein n=1 Tax=uncultured Thermomicrobiales bacterium TaxID=1645740 RepID=A0A6J4VBT7_9BACT|nr:MAG: hypothetical protein AVDCRST_MAG87-2722 [uncultured Thermomicrobiales bacterium]